MQFFGGLPDQSGQLKHSYRAAKKRKEGISHLTQLSSSLATEKKTKSPGNTSLIMCFEGKSLAIMGLRYHYTTLSFLKAFISSLSFGVNYIDRLLSC